MKLKNATMLLLFCMLLSPVAMFAQRGTRAVPEGANLEQYPFFSHVLTTRETADLGLRPITINQPWTGFNWFGNKDRFVLETLPVGTLVLADKDGRPIYKADCGNRLVELAACPKCVVASPATPPTPRSKGFGHEGWDFKKLLHFLAGIVLFLLGLLLILLLLYLLRRMFHALFGPIPTRTTADGGGERTTTSVLPPPSPTSSGAPRVQSSTPTGPIPLRPSDQPNRSVPASSMPRLTAEPPRRKFLNFYAAISSQPNKLKFGGYGEVLLDEEGDGTITIRFRQ